MERYIARQPIFDQSMGVSAYELLYRTGFENTAGISDGDKATRSLLSDAVMGFDLNKLTNSKMAFVNFTEHLLMDGFVLLADPKQVTVEILEDTHVSPALLDRLMELKDKGYRLALDDYTGDPDFEPLLPLVDVLKVDFILTDEKTQEQIAARFRHGRIKLLAEKVETRAEFDRAVRIGYRLFQGYFFEKPTLISKQVPDQNYTAYIRLIRELNKADVELSACADIIRTDATITYKLLKKVKSCRYYHGNSIQLVQQAVSFLGIDELYHWVILLMARDMNKTGSDETVREAYLRGVFTEQLMARSPLRRSKNDGFLLGMFSLMDRIMGTPLENVLKEVALPQDVADALLNRQQNELSNFLGFIQAYDSVDGYRKLSGLDLDLDISMEELVDLYTKCIQETDWAFDVV